MVSVKKPNKSRVCVGRWGVPFFITQVLFYYFLQVNLCYKMSRKSSPINFDKKTSPTNEEEIKSVLYKNLI